jgi:hypothetical protein
VGVHEHRVGKDLHDRCGEALQARAALGFGDERVGERGGGIGIVGVKSLIFSWTGPHVTEVRLNPESCSAVSRPRRRSARFLPRKRDGSIFVYPARVGRSTRFTSASYSEAEHVATIPNRRRVSRSNVTSRPSCRALEKKGTREKGDGFIFLPIAHEGDFLVREAQYPGFRLRCMTATT